MRIALARATVATGADPSVCSVARAFNDAVSVLESNLSATPTAVYVDVAASATPDSPFLVTHNLGVRPTMFTWQAEGAANCYATANDKQEWDGSIIKIRCTVADVALRVKVEVV